MLCCLQEGSSFKKEIVMQKKLFLCLILMIGMCVLLAGTGYSGENKSKVLPSEYPSSWGVIFQQAAPLPSGYVNSRTTTTLQKGSVAFAGAMALPCNIIWDRDVPVPLRDGAVIYTDVFRPESTPTNLPAIIAWSPYGKSVPQTSGGSSVPAEWFSGWAKSEGPDAAFWCCNGYAVVNPDVRGTNMSEGNIYFWGEVDAADGYDVVEWAAKEDWSNGKVGFHGTSWLAIAQWFIAATQPPHLAAIAPWNGQTDLYRYDILQGGIPDIFFNSMVAPGLVGENYSEQPWAMVGNYTLRSAYSDDKAAKLEKITVPAYVVADGGTTLHRFGALEGFRRIKSKNKWLRINNTNEWNDQYNPTNQQDLLLFFDRYLKGISNGWESTARVRVSVLDPGGADDVNVPFSKWPLAETKYQKYYLDAAQGTLSTKPTAKASSVRYDGATGQTTFTIKFAEDTTLIGYSKLRLWVEADTATDMDLFVLVEKLDADGNVLTPDPVYSALYFPVPPPGAPGRLRVSRRELDSTLSTSFMPVLSLRKKQLLTPGKIVPVDIAICPEGVKWHAGQQLRLIVAGHHIDGLTVPTINAGNHIIHAGGKYASYLQLPIIP
jgi:uncharacterized protein